MTTTTSQYGSALAEQLRTNGVREREVREIVAQVRAHCEMTGEDPVAAFGQPLDYARTWKPLHWTTWLGRVLAAALGLAGLGALVSALFAAEVGWAEQADVDSGVLFVIVAWAISMVFSWSVGLWFARRRAASLGQAPMGWPSRLLKAVAWCVFAAGVVSLFWWGSLSWAGHGTLFSQPRWLLLAFGVLTLPGLKFWGRPSRNLPAPPNDTFRARVRRFWG